MSQHVPDDLLAAFVDGEVSEQLAVHIAEHLDDCPACSAQAVALEPLAAAFAAVEDPRVPADLVASILAAGLVVKTYWRRILAKLGIASEREEEPEPREDDPA